MSILRTLAVSAAAALALSFSAACNTGDAGQPEKTITIKDAHGNARSVTVLVSEHTETSSYAEVRMGERGFTLSQWIDGGALHSKVSADDSALRYEYIADAQGGKLLVTDAQGEHAVGAGEGLGSMDEDAAALLLNFRQGEGGYAYQTYCVGYDTSNPADWHLVVGSCTCEHWYSIICTMN